MLVYIHGNEFVSGDRMNYGPDNFLDIDVILVSGNSRLGALGFLSTEDDYCPGNFGFKDQVMILKWIQENIKQFGGDPQRYAQNKLISIRKSFTCNSSLV